MPEKFSCSSRNFSDFACMEMDSHDVVQPSKSSCFSYMITSSCKLFLDSACIKVKNRIARSNPLNSCFPPLYVCVLYMIASSS